MKLIDYYDTRVTFGSSGIKKKSPRHIAERVPCPRNIKRTAARGHVVKRTRGKSFVRKEISRSPVSFFIYVPRDDGIPRWRLNKISHAWDRGAQCEGTESLIALSPWSRSIISTSSDVRGGLIVIIVEDFVIYALRENSASSPEVIPELGIMYLNKF